jgi:3-hydroxyisobutyrate dehydrogenase-like beta-hydroxyacid dehydrogenase
MGSVIARRLAAAGFGLRVWNRTAERARALGVGAVAETPTEATRGADVVLSILFGPDSVRAVYAQLEPAAGQVFCEMTTGGPEVVEELAPRIEAAGAELLAAPIVGSIPALEKGTALVLVGGSDSAFERVRSVLGAFGQPRHVGDRRQAEGLKLINNAMLGGSSLLAAELLAAASRAGLDRDVVFELLCRTMPYLEVRRRGYLDRAHQPPWFELRGMVKDLSLALQLGHRAGASMPAVALARELYQEAAQQHGHEEMTAVIERYLGDSA